MFLRLLCCLTATVADMKLIRQEVSCGKVGQATDGVFVFISLRERGLNCVNMCGAVVGSVHAHRVILTPEPQCFKCVCVCVCVCVCSCTRMFM